MDQDTFDLLSRQVSAAKSRRGALRALIVGGFATGMAALLPGAAEASQTIKGCRPPGQGCNSNKKCCSGKCRSGRCKCLGRGKSCLVPYGNQGLMLPNKAVCCTSKCSRGKNKCK